MSHPLRLFLVDDHKMVRAGLRALLQDDSRIEVVGEAGCKADALLSCPACSPDVVLIDVRLPDGKGFEICQRLKELLPAVKILVLTSYGDEDLVLEALGAGADGYLLKEIEGADLAQAIVTVRSSGAVFDRTITRAVLSRLHGSPKPLRSGVSSFSDLSVQERRILELVAEAKTNKEIAQQMGLAEKTVRNYFSNVLAKLGLQRRTEAAAWYILNDGDKERSTDHF